MLKCKRCGQVSSESIVSIGDIDMRVLNDGICGGSFIREEDNQDYVTTMACVNPQRAIVAVMHYDKTQDGYTQRKCSEPLSVRGADALAKSWAAALKLEIR